MLAKTFAVACSGPAKDVQRKVRLQEEHFVLARDSGGKGGSFEPFTLLQPGGLEKGLNPFWTGCRRCARFDARHRPAGDFRRHIISARRWRFGAGPTVVIVNHIVYEGSCPLWIGAPWGNVWDNQWSLHFSARRAESPRYELRTGIAAGRSHQLWRKESAPFFRDQRPRHPEVLQRDPHRYRRANPQVVSSIS